MQRRALAPRVKTSRAQCLNLERLEHAEGPRRVGIGRRGHVEPSVSERAARDDGGMVVTWVVSGPVRRNGYCKLAHPTQGSFVE
jgi:hypothetical protein